MLSLSSPLLLAFSNAAPAPPAKEGLFDCTVTKAGHIEMHTRPGSKTLPYKSSYCEFRGNQNEIKSCSGLDSVHPGCNNCQTRVPPGTAPPRAHSSSARSNCRRDI